MSGKARVVLLAAAAITLAAAIAAYSLLSYKTSAQALPKSFTVSGHTFEFSTYAVTVQQQEQGLMNQTITNGTFMLFVFPLSSIYPFWMYNTYNALDIMWLNGTKDNAMVVYVAANAPSCLSTAAYCENHIYTPNAVANYVIETKAGFVQEYAVVIGTHIRFNRQ